MTEPDAPFPTTLGAQNEHARSFAEQWERGRPELGEFIAKAGQLSDDEFLAVVRIDQDQRWHRGERVFVESYLERFPQLRGNEKSTLDLIYGEISLRDRKGESPAFAEYGQRFPQFSALLQRHFAMQQQARTEGKFETQTFATTEQNFANGSEPANALRVQLSYAELQFHARGGLGAVYMANDRALHREVAVKFMHERYGQDEESRARFVREAEVTGRLEHPGVVPVHGVGLAEDGRPFYVMRFIRGDTLETAIQHFQRLDVHLLAGGAYGLEFRGLLARFVSVCNTIAYAHNRGIIHRDIKPDNIMLGKYGETLVVDWGLALPVNRDERARASGEKTLIPKSGSQSGDSSEGGAGTPAYMSPEQAEGRLDIDAETDIYSLGATLYKLLTGELAFQGQNPREMMQQVKLGHFQPPTKVKSDVPRALEAICLKAMAHKPKDRYASALDLAKDVESWLGDEPVSAYQEPLRQKVARWARRHRTWAQASLLAVLAIILVSVVSAVWLGRLAGRERKAREQGLVLSAKFAAKTVASEIDLRWRILEMESADSKLRAIMERANADPKDKGVAQELQAWLNERFIAHDKTTRAGSWFVSDSKGALLAVSRNSSDRFVPPIGQNFAYRDYFHGKGRDLTPEELKAGEHIEEVHRSTCFHSKHDKKLKVAFSVPLWSDDGHKRFLGVLAMAVELGQFGILQTDLGQNRFAMLVDTKPDFVEKEEKKGLVLHHPRMEAMQVAGELKTDQALRVDADLLGQMETLREIRLRQDALERTSEKPADAKLNLAADYIDPTDHETGWLAAFEPVIVKGRSNANKDTGWVVVVQERK